MTSRTSPSRLHVFVRDKLALGFAVAVRDNIIYKSTSVEVFIHTYTHTHIADTYLFCTARAR